MEQAWSLLRLECVPLPLCAGAEAGAVVRAEDHVKQGQARILGSLGVSTDWASGYYYGGTAAV